MPLSGRAWRKGAVVLVVDEVKVVRMATWRAGLVWSRSMRVKPWRPLTQRPIIYFGSSKSASHIGGVARRTWAFCSAGATPHRRWRRRKQALARDGGTMHEDSCERRFAGSHRRASAQPSCTESKDDIIYTCPCARHSDDHLPVPAAPSPQRTRSTHGRPPPRTMGH